MCPCLMSTTVFLILCCWYFSLECTFTSFTLTHNDGWKCKLIISLILLTMWYDNNILKRAHEWDSMRLHWKRHRAANDRLYSLFTTCMRTENVYSALALQNYESRQLWWITSDWHTKIITHSFCFVHFVSCFPLSLSQRFSFFSLRFHSLLCLSHAVFQSFVILNLVVQIISIFIWHVSFQYVFTLYIKIAIFMYERASERVCVFPC